jgi:hypothetical protein
MEKEFVLIRQQFRIQKKSAILKYGKGNNEEAA